MATLLGGDYEDFIEAGKKRDGRLGLGNPLAVGDSHTYISTVVRHAWLHITGNSRANDLREN
jgi:hypothetical protein